MESKTSEWLGGENLNRDADQKFDDFLQEWAKRKGCTFVVEAFDGRESDEPIDGMNPDDVWGWLLPNGTTERTDDNFDDNFGCVEWSVENGKLRLSWNKYDF